MPGIQEITQSLGLDFSAESKGKFKGLEAVVWRLKNNITNSDNPLGSDGDDWELADDSANEHPLLSTAVTESGTGAGNGDGGFFTFGSIGYWLVLANFFIYYTSGVPQGASCYLVSENGGAYANIGRAFTVCDTNNATVHTSSQALLKVEDIAHTFKTSFVPATANGVCSGSGNMNYTSVCFIKLADL